MKPQPDILHNLKRHGLLADGMTQQDLAEQTGVTRQTILALEKGRYNPTIGLALRLASHCRCLPAVGDGFLFLPVPALRDFRARSPDLGPLAASGVMLLKNEPDAE